MLVHNTIEKLREMKLGTMARTLQKILDDSTTTELGFEDKVSLIVDAEYTARQNSKLKRLTRNANFEYPGASLEDIEYRADRKLDKALIARLASCTYIEEFRNIILMGATGSGKTWLSNAFGIKAVQNFMPVKYVRLPDILADFAIAHAEGTYRKVLRQYVGVRLLVLDEWLLYPLKEHETRDLLEIVEKRYHKASTIFCSQFDVGGWHQKIGDPTLADAIVDRIAHDSYKIVIAGDDSMRRVKGIQQEG
jgi:DNA replication protein DnaC